MLNLLLEVKIKYFSMHMSVLDGDVQGHKTVHGKEVDMRKVTAKNWQVLVKVESRKLGKK